MSYDQFLRSIPGRDLLIIELADPLQDFYAVMRTCRLYEYDVSSIFEVALRELSQEAYPKAYLATLSDKLSTLLKADSLIDNGLNTDSESFMVDFYNTDIVAGAVKALIHRLYFGISVASECPGGTISHRLVGWLGPFSIVLEKHIDVGLEDGKQIGWRDAISAGPSKLPEINEETHE